MAPAGDDVVVVSAETLTRVGTEMLDTAEELLRNVTWFTNGEATTAATARGFAASRELDDCETGWDRTLRVAGETVAVQGDTLVVNANVYHDVEIAILTKFEDR
ncbi:hypothetical protein [Actinophytocola gossypii]|uniref:Uncharacterized protein n=1 Tax=Actinophytocola gossypii TaxID=2812003 RepID=A0ABT2JIB8_9PSEU|nr:hypothetical protein [Actinophytocola gossypii]MCT2587627.1 hypothetical protein [Actinophytocola gossypii]